MIIVNMLQAKSSLSRLVETIEQKKEAAIIIARNGRPAAKLVPIETSDATQRIGVARGKFIISDNIDGDNDQIAQLFLGDAS